MKNVLYMFDDGSHIAYVNGSYTGDYEVGRLCVKWYRDMQNR